jgi:hypothetical protein
MRTHRLIIFNLIITLSLTIYGQADQQLNKETGMSFFTIDRNPETLNHRLEPKFVYGIYFNRYFSNLSWISNLEFGKNVINDNCPRCADTFYGKGKMTELIISSGLRYSFLKQRSLIIKPFIESDLYYSYVLYKGDFGGGFTGAGIKVDKSYNTFGILVRAGLSFYPVHKISLTISSSSRFGTGTVNNHYQNSHDIISCSTMSALQIRLGYLF